MKSVIKKLILLISIKYSRQKSNVRKGSLDLDGLADSNVLSVEIRGVSICQDVNSSNAKDVLTKFL